MNKGEFFDLILDHGGPIEAARATGHKEDIIYFLEEEIKKDKEYLKQAKENQDKISIVLNKDNINMTREVIERLKTL